VIYIYIKIKCESTRSSQLFPNYFYKFSPHFIHFILFIPRGGRKTMQSSKKNLVSVGIHGMLRLMIVFSLVSAGFTVPLPAPVQAKPTQPQDTWPVTRGNMNTARSHHTATLLQNGKVLVTGGVNPGESGNVTLNSAELFDPAAGLWTETDPMQQARQDHTATLLLNGKVLVVGGRANSTTLGSAELYDPATGTWSNVSSLYPSSLNLPSEARFGHTATLLMDGTVLIVGGQGASGALGTAQIYDPVNDAWMSASTLAPRAWHTANLLSDGKVMVVGGQNGAVALKSFQVYDPDVDGWSPSVNLGAARWGHTTTALTDGTLLVVGGQNGTNVLLSAERLTKSGATWTVADTVPLNTARFSHSATLQPNGDVLIVGGQSELASGHLITAEVYRFASSTFEMVENVLSTWRSAHTATLLPGGDVLVAGGNNTASLNTADMITPDSGSWKAVNGSLSVARYSPMSITLKDGRVMVLGGQTAELLDNVDIYNPVSATWSTAASMPEERMMATVTLLPDGKVLLAGGQGNGNNGDYHNAAWLYDPAYDTWSVTGSMHDARASHTAILLPNGQVMVMGGQNSGGALDTVEFYNLASGTWTPGPSLNMARYHHTATRLQDGTILVVGGQGTSTLSSTELYSPITGAWSTASGSLDAPHRDHTATLLPNGNVLIVGGNNGGTDYSDCQLYDAAAKQWNTAGSLIAPRSYHTATLLSNGKVLVVGGRYTGSPEPTLRSTELYDPATDTWKEGGDLIVGRYYHVASLLPNDLVLIAGGGQYAPEGATPLGTSELYGPSAGFSPVWRPGLGTPTAKVIIGQALTLTLASDLRGKNYADGAGGGQNSSPSNYPLVQLRRVDNNQVRWLLPDPEAGFSATSFTSLPVTKFASGPAVVTVFVNGIPSLSKTILFENITVYLPVVRKP
jgi:N-acetylneuraminic acid mutarotase